VRVSACFLKSLSRGRRRQATCLWGRQVVWALRGVWCLHCPGQSKNGQRRPGKERLSGMLPARLCACALLSLPLTLLHTPPSYPPLPPIPPCLSFRTHSSPIPWPLVAAGPLPWVLAQGRCRPREGLEVLEGAGGARTNWVLLGGKGTEGPQPKLPSPSAPASEEGGLQFTNRGPPQIYTGKLFGAPWRPAAFLEHIFADLLAEQVFVPEWLLGKTRNLVGFARRRFESCRTRFSSSLLFGPEEEFGRGPLGCLSRNPWCFASNLLGQAGTKNPGKERKEML